jgi:HSP20 family protein
LGSHRIGIIPNLSEELLEHFLHQILQRRTVGSSQREETDFPAVDISETADQIIVEAELPGISIKELEISICSGTLVIEGIKKETVEQERTNYLCMERTFGSFRRIIPLIRPVNPNTIKAYYRSGLLQILIPKVLEKRGKKKVISVITK